jgi:cytochrome c-type biogenesis protein CcmE
MAQSVILRDAARTGGGSKKLKFIVGGLVILALIGYLIINAVQSAGAYYREVGEVLEQRQALTGQSLRLSGNIVTSSIQYDAPTLDLRFSVSDPTDAGKQLPIHFHGIKPDQMEREGSSAIIEGSLKPDGTVEANNLLLKCPSRYEQQYDEIAVQAVK